MMSLSAMLRMCATVVVALALWMPVAAQTHLAVELARYQQETDPVRKARALAKLGDDQMALARKQLKEGQDVASLNTIEQYRDERHGEWHKQLFKHLLSWQHPDE